MKHEISTKNKIALFAIVLIAALALSSVAQVIEVKALPPDPSDASSIPKFVNQLTGAPPVYVPKIIKDPNGRGIAYEYTVTMDESMQQVLPAGYPQIEMGYGGNAKDAVTGKDLGYVLNSPGPSFEAVRGIPIVVSPTKSPRTTCSR